MQKPFMRGILVMCSLAAAALVAAAASGGDSRPPTALSDLAQFDDVAFITVCRFSHFRSDDPIVLPKFAGLSHNHTFFGNRSTNAFSTLSTLGKGATTCQRSDDRASYWAPTLLLDGKPVTPDEAQIYYRRSTLARVRVFPPGLKVVAGNANAQKPQSTHIVFWNCSTDVGEATASVPTCTTPSLHVHVRFPNCWDGKHVDSANHKSHMAYSSRGICPKSHPVAVPQLMLIIQYPVTGGASAELASGGQFSGHADFFNAWQQPELRRLVDYCLNALRTCGAVS
jgi:hypothetical protein